MIQIFLNCNKTFIWNAEDAIILRKTYRIVGKCIGCSVSAPYQNETLNLPMQIMEDAAKLLEERGIACIVDSVSAFEGNLKPTETEFKEMRKKSYDEQVLLGKADREKFLSKNADAIINSKIKKNNQANDEATRALLLQQLYNDTQPLPESASLIQIFTECPWPNINIKKSNWNYPKTEEENTRFEIFKHFWNTGYFITPGEKFGGDFLVYSGDPEITHSEFIIVCKPHHEKISMLEFITKGRLGTSVKKTVLFCSVVNGKVNTVSLNWTHWI